MKLRKDIKKARAKKPLVRAWVITSSIACGKSSFCALLGDVISADALAAKVLYAKRKKVARRILKTSYKNFLANSKASNKFLDFKKALRAKIFNEKIPSANKAKRKLEKLLHYRIKRYILKSLKNQAKFFEIPLYFESKNYKHFVNKLVVFSSEEKQIERLMKRDNCSRDEALRMINSQLCLEYKKAKANYLVENNSSLEDLKIKSLEFKRMNNV